MNNNVTLTEKLEILIKSSKDYRGVLLIGLLFILIGGIVVFLGLRFDFIFLIIFGGIFIAFAIFFLSYTIPSSYTHYYDKALLKQYGRKTNARLLSKEVIDNSHYDPDTYAHLTKKKGKLITELNYLLTFSFEYQNKVYENSDFVEIGVFEKLTIGDVIPVKFLSIDPNKASIRTAKLKTLVK